MQIKLKDKILILVITVIVSVTPVFSGDTEETSKYFESIRKNQAMLTAFFNGMPKGGDLHHHFSGSVYAENYFKVAVDNNFFVNWETGDSYQTPPQTPTKDAPIDVSKDIPKEIPKETKIMRIKDFINDKGELAVKLKLISLWSIKDFKETQQSPDKHFFEAFRKFGRLINGNEHIFLKEIKERAMVENVQYIETMFLRPSYNKEDSRIKAFNDKYYPSMKKIQENRKLQKEKSEEQIKSLFDEMLKSLTKEMEFEESAKDFAETINIIHQKSKLPEEDEKRLLIRYQNYITRTDTPGEVFMQIYLSFQSDSISDLIVGTNIVGPEDNPTAMRDYWLHMEMFKYFHKKYPKLKYSMHAGELSVGIVPPEDLSWHINSAFFDAEANRIGHGVDIPYEKDCYSLLEKMKEKQVPVEINMLSNEFILGIKNDFHPFLLYHKSGVPIVITSDDMGVLRTSFTEQFAILAKRYEKITYKDIKGFIYNSIRFSFLNDIEKENLKKRVDKEFIKFEKTMAQLDK